MRYATQDAGQPPARDVFDFHGGGTLDLLGPEEVDALLHELVRPTFGPAI